MIVHGLRGWLSEPHNLQAEHKELFQYVVTIDIVHSYSRSVVHQAVTSIIQEVVTMVAAKEKYSLLKSTYIRLQTNYQHK